MQAFSSLMAALLAAELALVLLRRRGAGVQKPRLLFAQRRDGCCGSVEVAIADALDGDGVEARREAHRVCCDIAAAGEQLVRVLVVAEGADEAWVGEQERVDLVFAAGGCGEGGGENFAVCFSAGVLVVVIVGGFVEWVVD